MNFTLWRGADLLGVAELSESDGARKTMNGPFHPTPAFATVWPILQAWQDSVANMVVGLRSEESRASAQVRDQMLANANDPEYQAAELAVAALALELRDADGHTIPGVQIRVTEWDLFALTSPDPEVRAEAERDAAEAGISTRGFAMTVTAGRSRSSRA